MVNRSVPITTNPPLGDRQRGTGRRRVLLATLLLVAAGAQARFPGGPQTITRDAPGANVVHAADLDGDGDADVLSASYGDDKIAWYENLGEGEFSEPNVLTADADFARWVMTADLDGDGDLDVLSASDYDNKVSWYENVGGGRFTAQRNIATDFDQSLRLDTADFDGDGDLDVVASGHELAWFENLGNAGSWARNSISPHLESRWNVKAADLDGDGDADVVNSATSDNKLVWHRNDGEGVFSEEIVIATGVDRPIGIEIGDLDGDGDLDLVSASRLDDRVAWYENLGDGSFADQRVITDRADNANAVHLADIDGDGDLDVLSASSHDNRLAWYENLCNREFSEPKIITTAVAAPWSVYAADLDGDGDLDVLSASEGDRRVAWYENHTPQGAHFALCTIHSDGDDRINSVHASDLDNDGDLDLAWTGESNERIAWYANLGSGFTRQQPIAQVNGATWIHSADIDGDGDADPVAAIGNRIVWFESTDGSFSNEELVSETYKPVAVDAADFDGDGDIDLVSAGHDYTAVYWHENLGGRFAQEIGLPGTSHGSSYIGASVHATDLDGDGDIDVLSATHNEDKIAWYTNAGDGEFTEQRVISTAADGADSVFAADLDGDGYVDVLSASRNDNKIAWYRNLGGGGFSDQRVISTDVGGARSVAAADFDDDGDFDVLYAGYGADRNYNDGTSGWFENLGNGTFSSAFEVRAWGAVHAVPADIDADGDPDIVVALMDAVGRVILYRNLTRVGTPPTAAPSNVEATAEVSRLHVTWLAISASDVGGSYITRYVATARQPDGNVAATCEAQPPALACTIEGLQPATVYTVTVHAENSRGAGPASTAIRVRTLALPGSYRFVPESPADGAGFSLAHTADRDGDGSADVAIGAPFHSIGGIERRGAVYLVASSDLRAADAADGVEDGGIYLHNVAGWRNSYKLVGERAGDNAGWSVAGIGDLDADGTADLAIGAPNGATQAAYLIATADLAAADRDDGARDGVIELRFAERQANSWKIAGQRGDRMGSSVVGAGDTDADGRDEVLLFARGETTDATNGGALYLVDPDDLPDADAADGGTDRLVRTPHLPTQPGTRRFVGGRLGGPVGGVLASAGDSDADGRGDVLIGAPRASPRDRSASGAAFVAASTDFEAADAADGADGTIDLANLAAMSASWRLIGEQDYDEAGASVAGAGDIDGDGRSDLIVGAPGHSHGGGFLGGAAYLVAAAGLSGADADDGSSDGSIDLAAVAGQAGSYKFVGDSLDGAGVSLSAAGDPDGDGVADLLIGAQGQAAWLIAVDDLPGADSADGAADGVVALGNVADQADSYRLVLGSGRLYPTATSLAAGGDIDGDRVPDLLVGVSGGVDGGGVYLLSTRDLDGVDSADGTNDAVLHLERIGPATLPLPELSITVEQPPVDIRRGLGEARTRLRWRVTSPWQAHPSVDYAVAVDDERVVLDTTDGTLAVGTTVETALEFDCTAPERIAATVTIRAGNASRGTPWTVYCTSGNAADLVVELHQGPMAWQWDSLAETATAHLDAIHGRRAALVVETVAETSAVPVPTTAVRDGDGTTLSADLPLFIEPDGPDRRGGFYGTTRILDLSAELHGAGNEIVVELPSDAGTAEGVSYVIALPGRTLPKFDITFFPIRSGARAPAEFEAADYMEGMFDLFPIADDYAARVGEEHEYGGGGWDVGAAALELLNRWNEEAEEHEYYHGIFKYPRDGSTCGYAWLGRPVGVSAGLNDGCTPNIHAHELGHNFGLPHAPGGCGAGNVDPDYPYDNAGIGPRRGWLFSAARFVDPDDGYYDTMSYCRPNFISDYNYRKVVEFLTPDEEESSARASAAAMQAGENEGESTPTAARSIALTGTADAAGNWSLEYATTTDRRSRPSKSGTFTLEILGAGARILHSEPLGIHVNNQGTLWAWTARVPFPRQAVARVVVRDAKGIVLDREVALSAPAAR